MNSITIKKETKKKVVKKKPINKKAPVKKPVKKAPIRKPKNSTTTTKTKGNQNINQQNQNVNQRVVINTAPPKRKYTRRKATATKTPQPPQPYMYPSQNNNQWEFNRIHEALRKQEMIYEKERDKLRGETIKKDEEILKRVLLPEMNQFDIDAMNDLNSTEHRTPAKSNPSVGGGGATGDHEITGAYSPIQVQTVQEKLEGMTNKKIKKWIDDNTNNNKSGLQSFNKENLIDYALGKIDKQKNKK
jgi:hypothetical protein